MKKILDSAENWFESRGWKPFPFQTETWDAYLNGWDGIVNAPTGSGKTYSLLVPIVLKAERKKLKGVRAIWITPIRALAKEIKTSADRFLKENEIPWRVAIRTGDTPQAEKAKQKRSPPELLITTPESLHLLLAQKKYDSYFKNLDAVVVDEWHELIGSKRGVQMELALSRLKKVCNQLRIWGISATIGNLDEARNVLLGTDRSKEGKFIKADIKKEIELRSVMPDEVERFPWAGHLGIKLLPEVAKIIDSSTSTLIFTNTRSQAEIWFHRLLDARPDLAGVLAMHHGSISREMRDWVEEALYEGRLKAVVCTSSLDLGVDFRPVETIVQIGGPKGVARFVQRAGRSGHAPGQKSTIHFVPTNSLELIEAAALRQAIAENYLENRTPYLRSFDVLSQYLVTLAVSDGFDQKEIFEEVKTTHAYKDISEEEWTRVLTFITSGGESLGAYDEFKKVEIVDGKYLVTSRRTAMRHRLNMGTIVSDSMIAVKFLKGGFIGSVEEWFVSRLKEGDVFWFAGRSLEFIRIKDMQALVKKSKSKKGQIPSWQGGRLPLTSHMSHMLRRKLTEAMVNNKLKDPELEKVQPLLKFQEDRSHVPLDDEFLIEKFTTREGFHVLMYPFDGRLVHQGIAGLIAYRISKMVPISFSLAFNDYGFELLSDSEIPIEKAIEEGVFETKNLYADLRASINESEMARRKFRDIASISGLVFKGYPGKAVKEKHLQSSSQLFYDVFEQYDPSNLLLNQAHDEVLEFELEFQRFHEAMERIGKQKIIVKSPQKPTPFSFPIMVDRLRERLSSEKLEDRIKKMSLQFED
ncbi:ligase-associated DNA damage response DEXH box helicase [Halocola ammonii]